MESVDDLRQQSLDETGYWGRAGAGCLVYAARAQFSELDARRVVSWLEPDVAVPGM